MAGNTLGELLSKFASASASTSEGEASTRNVHEQVLEGGQQKTASTGGTQMDNNMGSLAMLYMSMTEMDKTAGQSVGMPEGYDDNQITDEDLEKIANAEAEQLLEHEATQGSEQDMMKVAAEYDAAGRIMARGFFDEYVKLAAGAMDTSTGDNQGTDAESQSSTPSFGQRGLPTLATNYAGAPQAGIKGKAVGMNTSGGKEVYKNSLKPSGSKGAGDIVGQQPDAHAGGAFATVRDVMDSNR